jgi:hypothetical protein
MGLTTITLAASLQPPAAPPAAGAPAMLTPAPPEATMPRFAESCPEAVGSEIVVCGRRDADERHRLRGAGPSSDADAPRGPLGFQISESVRMEIEPVQFQRPDGFVDRRVVVRFRIAF